MLLSLDERPLSFGLVCSQSLSSRTLNRQVFVCHLVWKCQSMSSIVWVCIGVYIFGASLFDFVSGVPVEE